MNHYQQILFDKYKAGNNSIRESINFGCRLCILRNKINYFSYFENHQSVKSARKFTIENVRLSMVIQIKALRLKFVSSRTIILFFYEHNGLLKSYNNLPLSYATDKIQIGYMKWFVITLLTLLLILEMSLFKIFFNYPISCLNRTPERKYCVWLNTKC